MTWSGYFFEGELLLLDLESGTTTSLIEHELVGPRVAAPRPDGREHARRTVSGLSTDWAP